MYEYQLVSCHLVMGLAQEDKRVDIKKVAVAAAAAAAAYVCVCV